MFRRKVVRRTTLISIGLFGVLLGLFLAFFGFSIKPYWLIVAVLFIPFLKKKRYITVCMVLCMGFSVGTWRGQAFYADFLLYEQFYGKPIVISGVVKDDAGHDDSTGQTQFHVGSVRIGDKHMIGRVQVITRETVKISRGDVVRVSGKLKPSKGTSRQGFISSAKVMVVSKNDSFIEKMRSKFFGSVQSALPDPQASLGLGYLVGMRVSIPKELEDQLSMVGLTHIVAVSGYNLTVIVQAVRRLLGKRSAYQSVVVATLLIAGFLAVTGGSAPIVRAAVICGFSLLAWYYGRAIKPVLLLLLSGAMTAFVNPLYVWGDPGWYLSFLAFAGVLILGPLLSAWVFRKKPPGTISQMLIETLCAQICTVPYTLYLFGGVSLIAPIANVFVLPFIPIVMMFVFAAGVVGLFSPVLATVIGLVPTALLSLQIWLIQVFSKVPGARAEVGISVFVMIGLFAVILIVLLLLGKSARVLASKSVVS